MIRKRGVVIGAVSLCFLLGLGLVAARSQDRAMSAAPVSNGGVFVTPVPGAPFSAIAEQEMTQVLKDGSSFQRKTTALIARDLQGRIHNESREVLPFSSTREPALLSIHIYDPDTRLNTFLNPASHIARQSTLPNPPSTAPPNNWAQQEPNGAPQRSNAQLEDLGTNVLEGLEVHGYRRTLTVSAKNSGTGEPIVVTDEYWYSEELHLNLLATHNDPRTAKLTITVTHVSREQPSPDLFQVPANYKLVDVTPPE